MALKLTPQITEAAYELLRSTPPFNKWNLPDGEDVVFRVSMNPKYYGHFIVDGKKKFSIEISANCVGQLKTLIPTMAHEMIHMHEALCGIAFRGEDHHSMAFRQWALEACKVHGWDYKDFW